MPPIARSEGEAPEETTGVTETPEPAVEAPQTPSASPEGLERIYERMDQMSAQQRQLADQLAPLFEEPEPEPEYYDDGGELTEDGVRAVVSDYVREQIDAQLAPRERQARAAQREDEWDALKESFPDLQDPKVAKPLVDRAMAWAQSHNPELIDGPGIVDVIEWMYAKSKYDTTAAQQTSAGEGRHVVLESAAGAAPNGKGPNEVDWQARVIEAAKRSQPLI
jgi:hypothetical protein